MERRKSAAICLLVLLLTLSAATLLNPQLNLINKVHASNVSLTLYANSAAWNNTKPQGSNPTITVSQGDILSITLIGVDVSHEFLLDLDKNGSNPDCPGPDICSSNVAAGQTVTMTPFSVNTPGNYTYYCVFHPFTMIGKFVVLGPDYRVSPSPSSLTIPQGSKANSTVSITGLNNFAGSITLSSSPSSPPGLLTSSFNVNPIIVPASGTAQSNFTISVPASTSPGTYSIIVTARNSTTFSHAATISVTVPAPDFSIATSPTTLTIQAGDNGTTTVTLSSLNNFTGSVSLTADSPTVSISPTNVTLSSGATRTSTLTITTTSTTTPGTYTMTVTGAMGSNSHKATLTVTVTAAPNPRGTASPTGLPAVVLYGAIGGIMAAVAALLTFLFLRKKNK